jgi:hypothetical protein
LREANAFETGFAKKQFCVDPIQTKQQQTRAEKRERMKQKRKKKEAKQWLSAH